MHWLDSSDFSSLSNLDYDFQSPKPIGVNFRPLAGRPVDRVTGTFFTRVGVCWRSGTSETSGVVLGAGNCPQFQWAEAVALDVRLMFSDNPLANLRSARYIASSQCLTDEVISAAMLAGNVCSFSDFRSSEFEMTPMSRLRRLIGCAPIEDVLCDPALREVDGVVLNTSRPRKRMFWHHTRRPQVVTFPDTLCERDSNFRLQPIEGKDYFRLSGRSQG